MVGAPSNEPGTGTDFLLTKGTKGTGTLVLAGRGGGGQSPRDSAGPSEQGEDLSQNITIGPRGKCKGHEGWAHRL